MLKILLKKQLFEIFKGYFYDAKNNKMRSKLSTFLGVLFFLAIMIGLLGGMFTFFASSMCKGLVACKTEWLYFLIMGFIAIMIGSFGSIYNSYNALYLSKDNELLLSMPIPPRDIVISRLLTVYVMGIMYILTVTIPMEIVYFQNVQFSTNKLICGILMILSISFFVMVVSCLIGLIIAKISVKLKNRSFVTVFLSLIFMGVYYFCYFKANELINNLVLNAVTYGTKIKGNAYILYAFGSIGEGKYSYALSFFCITIAALALLCYLMMRSFIGIVTTSEKTSKVKYVSKKRKEKSLFGAVLSKEFARFFASPSYMLNCGIGLVFLIVSGIFILIKKEKVLYAFDFVMAANSDDIAVYLLVGMLFLVNVCDIAAPSVSLEGKSLWVMQSLPVPAKMTLFAKAFMQIILTIVPMIFATICILLVSNTSVTVAILIVCLAIMYVIFSGLLNTIIAIKMPVLTWTNELEPIKRSGGTFLAIFGGFGIVAAIFFAYEQFFSQGLGASLFLTSVTVVLLFLNIVMTVWISKKGAKLYSNL
ncbi:hypothetical protein [Butyrivibrio sp. NC3005]|uniref:hypothetical protein n=1 Tax=Butyrivibrio sp. NC3005 TaxID=1280685 RepID=UPI0004090ECF|nr:hypothetical protein [Butyrivibrio sp. NC3005]